MLQEIVQRSETGRNSLYLSLLAVRQPTTAIILLGLYLDEERGEGKDGQTCRIIYSLLTSFYSSSWFCTSTGGQS